MPQRAPQHSARLAPDTDRWRFIAAYYDCLNADPEFQAAQAGLWASLPPPGPALAMVQDLLGMGAAGWQADVAVCAAESAVQRPCLFSDYAQRLALPAREGPIDLVWSWLRPEQPATPLRPAPRPRRPCSPPSLFAPFRPVLPPLPIFDPSQENRHDWTNRQFRKMCEALHKQLDAYTRTTEAEAEQAGFEHLKPGRTDADMQEYARRLYLSAFCRYTIRDVAEDVGYPRSTVQTSITSWCTILGIRQRPR
jgi:hypothetical protein